MAGAETRARPARAYGEQHARLQAAAAASSKTGRSNPQQFTAEKQHIYTGEYGEGSGIVVVVWWWWWGAGVVAPPSGQAGAGGNVCGGGRWVWQVVVVRCVW